MFAKYVHIVVFTVYVCIVFVLYSNHLLNTHWARPPHQELLSNKEKIDSINEADTTVNVLCIKITEYIGISNFYYWFSLKKLLKYLILIFNCEITKETRSCIRPSYFKYYSHYVPSWAQYWFYL